MAAGTKYYYGPTSLAPITNYTDYYVLFYGNPVSDSNDQLIDSETVWQETGISQQVEAGMTIGRLDGNTSFRIKLFDSVNTSTRAEISDISGRNVRSLQGTSSGEDCVTFYFDGRDDSNEILPNGV